MFVAASIGAGFSVLGFSPYLGLQIFGRLMPLAMVLSCLASLTIMPVGFTTAAWPPNMVALPGTMPIDVTPLRRQSSKYSWLGSIESASATSVVIAVAGPIGTVAEEHVFPGTRVQVMEQIAERALEMLRDAIAAASK